MTKKSRNLAGLGHLIVFFCALSLSACSSMNYRKPEVSVADIAVVGGNLLEQRLRIKLRVMNPNDRQIAVDGLVFDLQVNEQAFAKGVSNQATIIPKLGEGILEVEASAQFAQLMHQLPEILGNQGRLRYRLRGEILTRDYGRFNFDRPGEYQLPDRWTERGYAR